MVTAWRTSAGESAVAVSKPSDLSSSRRASRTSSRSSAMSTQGFENRLFIVKNVKQERPLHGGEGAKKGLPQSGRQPSKAREHHPPTMGGVPISCLSHFESALLELPLLGLALRARLLLDDAAVEEVNGALGVAGKPGVVGDHADGRSFLVQLFIHFHHRLAVPRAD